MPTGRCRAAWVLEWTNVLYFSAAFLVIALLAGALAFGGIAGSATVLAQTVFTIFLILAAVSLVVRESRRLEHKSLEFD